MDKIQHWGPFVIGCISAVVALYLVCTLLVIGGFLAWLWKPFAIFAASVSAYYGIDIGVNGERPCR